MGMAFLGQRGVQEVVLPRILAVVVGRLLLPDGRCYCCTDGV